MYLSYVPGIFNDWNHPREIVHLTSRDGVKWDAVGPVDLKSDGVIDASVIQLPSGAWRMWYKDERKPKALSFADSPDLFAWEPKGSAVTDYNGEGPKVIHWKGRYRLIADCWANGMRVWSSHDATNWRGQDETLIGSHGDVVVNGERAWWFYFGGGRRDASANTAASRPPGAASTGASAPAPQSLRGRTTAINVVELFVVDGKLLAGDPDQPTHIVSALNGSPRNSALPFDQLSPAMRLSRSVLEQGDPKVRANLDGIALKAFPRAGGGVSSRPGLAQ
jgi:hypothetical protein